MQRCTVVDARGQAIAKCACTVYLSIFAELVKHLIIKDERHRRSFQRDQLPGTDPENSHGRWLPIVNHTGTGAKGVAG